MTGLYLDSKIFKQGVTEDPDIQLDFSKHLVTIESKLSEVVIHGATLD